MGKVVAVILLLVALLFSPQSEGFSAIDLTDPYQVIDQFYEQSCDYVLQYLPIPLWFRQYISADGYAHIEWGYPIYNDDLLLSLDFYVHFDSTLCASEGQDTPCYFMSSIRYYATEQWVQERNSGKIEYNE